MLNNKESSPAVPLKEKTQLDYFKEFLAKKRANHFLPFWKKMTGVPIEILEYCYDKSNP